MATIIPNLIILGPQGSGKSTQANLLVKRYGYLHISTGQLIRSRAKLNDNIAKQINRKILKGRLINTNLLFEHIIIPYLRNKSKERLIFDGIPRSLSQLNKFNTMLKNMRINMPYLLFIDIPRSEITRRISNRLICNLCGRVFKPGQKGYSNKICPYDNKKLSQRNDDVDNQAIKKRLEVFVKMTKKIIPYYKKNNRFIPIDGTKSIQQVDQEIRSKIKSL